MYFCIFCLNFGWKLFLPALERPAAEFFGFHVGFRDMRGIGSPGSARMMGSQSSGPTP